MSGRDRNIGLCRHNGADEDWIGRNLWNEGRKHLRNGAVRLSRDCVGNFKVPREDISTSQELLAVGAPNFRIPQMRANDVPH